MSQYPRRLIEVDLPIKRISAHARREKSIRHGHISTLHIWWARRPLAACRAVICAALWPDPADKLCPPAFRKAAAKTILDFARKVTGDTKLANDHCSPENFTVWSKLVAQPASLHSQPGELRSALLDFIADFANWDNSTVREYLDTSRALTQAAHESLGGAPGTRPLVVDPFAGGGSIPLEALRVGADAFASDLNPVPVLLNKVVLEYIPKYGQRLADEVRKWGEWIKREAEKELAEFYPKDPDGATPIAYLWARTIQCEGPGCGAEVPLIRSLWLAKKANRSVALQLVPDKKAKRVDFQIIVKRGRGWVNQDDDNEKIPEPKFDGTVKRGSATCPCCGYTTPVGRVRQQLKPRNGGAHDARMLCVVTTTGDTQARSYRLPTDMHVAANREAEQTLKRKLLAHTGATTLLPEEPTPSGGGRGAGRAFSQRNYGIDRFRDLFTPRQLLALTTIVRVVREAGRHIERDQGDGELGIATQTVLALLVDKLVDSNSGQVWWMASGEKTVGTFTRQTIQIIWDFAEIPISDGPSRSIGEGVAWLLRVIESVGAIASGCTGQATQANATQHPLANDIASALVTDPPYYDAVPYADLSDFFYVWLRRTLPTSALSSFQGETAPKNGECILDQVKGMDEAYFEQTMTHAMAEARRVVCPSGIGVVVFAHKTTAGWEAMLQGLLAAGWIISGTWPIDTERQAKVNTLDRAFLASSVHLVCRPRENPDGSVRTDEIGDWRDVLQELPRRIHEWMPRLAEEGVVGADAIFACLGPALEIFSRYSRVEKASGEAVTLREYLEQVWAAVAKEALTMIFKDADTTGFEDDARLTAMWLWTLSADRQALNAGNTDVANGESEGLPAGEAGGARKAKPTGFVLEYDAARKIAQGLGARLEGLTSVVDVSGETARLVPVAERAQYLFGKELPAAPQTKQRKSQAAQLEMGAVVKEALESSGTATASESQPIEGKVERAGKTVLDRIHQSMILFAAGRGEALKRFLVEDGMGRDGRFWSLAQALAALYPKGTDERRWVEGVLARKKGLGL
jgi:adenine-specific DNA methylase